MRGSIGFLARLQEAKNVFAEMERMGICKKASSPSHSEHEKHIWAVLQHLQENSLIVRFEKCTFGFQKADFLGHEVSPEGVCPLTSKVAAVTRFPIPASVKAIQEFLGMLTTDASNVACGAALEQVIDGTPQPIAFFSKKKNPVADGLSRVELNVVQLEINYEDLAREQAADPETPAYRTAIMSLKWRGMPLAPGGPSLLWRRQYQPALPLVPTSRCRQVFDVIHGFSHPSGRTTAKLLSGKFVWHRVQKDARTWARQCLQCQTSKVGRYTEAGVGKFPQPERYFSHIHIDVVGPLPPSGGSRYLLTVVECSTRWPEATPMQEATASACAEALLSSWVSRFGIPDHITTDRGPAFLSDCSPAWLGCWGQHITPPRPTTHRPMAWSSGFTGP
ncbi:uncharacterized protein [Macrobrachium rosenbergii]|uniref:uncharacterized protein n=1 Tax=Macrobrachium rosenbergii TaxID=79674 RepID=UPI0034D5B637